MADVRRVPLRKNTLTAPVRFNKDSLLREFQLSYIKIRFASKLSYHILNISINLLGIQFTRALFHVTLIIAHWYGIFVEKQTIINLKKFKNVHYALSIKIITLRTKTFLIYQIPQRFLSHVYVYYSVKFLNV